MAGVYRCSAPCGSRRPPKARSTFPAADAGGYLGVDLVLRETAPNVYDWDASEEQALDPAPATDLPGPFTVAPPTGLA